MKLHHLFSVILAKTITGNQNIDIEDIQVDSRKVSQGDLFVCIQGHTVDGHDYVDQAIHNGCVAILCEKKIERANVTVIQVNNTRRALALLTNKLYDYPSKKLKITAVTGTNGKTSTATMIYDSWSKLGIKAGLIGTIHTRFDNIIVDSVNTTPDILELQKIFKRMVENDITHVVMEVSSHALEEGRVWGTDFNNAVFTNLTQDHLDYHGTMDNYARSKSLLFKRLIDNHTSNKSAIINADDLYADQMMRYTSSEVITYGIHSENLDIQASEIQLGADGTTFTVKTWDNKFTVQTSLIGKFNIYNLLGVIAQLLRDEITVSRITEIIKDIKGVEGRCEAVNEGQNFSVIVDFAHTPDSLENVLKTLSELCTNKLYCVIGCGGNRDRMKRPMMANIAMKYADYSIFTSDNPRKEDPHSILMDMCNIPESDKHISIVDREKAIQHAINLAQEGDCVLIAGKGHETYQIIGDQKRFFSDRDKAKQAIQNRST